MFSPERRSKVVKFAKNDRLDVLIVMARDEQFSFSLESELKGGPLDDFSPFSFSIFSCFFYFFLTSSPLSRIIQS